MCFAYIQLNSDLSEAKLIDFGTSKSEQANNEKTLNLKITVSPAYSSPEIIEMNPITSKSDVYSFGIVL